MSGAPEGRHEEPRRTARDDDEVVPVWEGGDGQRRRVVPRPAPPRRPPGGWPVLTYRARLQDTILATVFTLVAGGLGLGGTIVAVVGDREAGTLVGLTAIPFGLVAWLAWRLRNQRVVLTDDALIYRTVRGTRRLPYADIVEQERSFALGMLVRTTDGRWIRMPWPPLRTASGWGTARLDEVAWHLEVRRDEHATRARRSGRDGA